MEQFRAYIASILDFVAGADHICDQGNRGGRILDGYDVRDRRWIAVIPGDAYQPSRIEVLVQHAGILSIVSLEAIELIAKSPCLSKATVNDFRPQRSHQLALVAGFGRRVSF